MDNQFYKQLDGVAMGNSLSLVIANQENWGAYKDNTKLSPEETTIRYCYVDDTFEIWPQGDDTFATFLNRLNSIHPRIHITMEKEINGGLLLLNISVNRRNIVYLNTMYTKNRFSSTAIFTEILTTIEHKKVKFSKLWPTAR